MAVNLSPVFGVAGQLFNDNGDPLAGGKIYTYLAGTTTPAPTYTTGLGNIAHTNPIVLDGAGRVPTGEIWLTDGITYKFVVEDSASNLIGTYDNLTGINSNFVNFTNEQEIQTATAGQTVFNLATMQYQPGTNSLSVFVDGVNQYGPGAQYAYVETDSDTVTFTNGLHVGAEVKFTTSQLNSSSGQTAGQTSFTGFKGQIGTVQDLADDDGSDWIGFESAGTGAAARSAQDKMRDVVSVKDFGAVGDGVTDDTTAILNAISACEILLKPLFFPAGTYIVTSGLTIKQKQVQIFGDGSESTVLEFNIASGPALDVGYVAGGAFWGWTIRDIQLKGNASGNESELLKINYPLNGSIERVKIDFANNIGVRLGRPQNFLIHDSEIRNSDSEGITVEQDFISGQSGQMFVLDNSTIKDCGTANSKFGIALLSGSEHVISNCIIEGSTPAANLYLGVDLCKITNCSFESGAGAGAHIQLGNTTGPVTTNNNFIGHNNFNAADAATQSIDAQDYVGIVIAYNQFQSGAKIKLGTNVGNKYSIIESNYGLDVINDLTDSGVQDGKILYRNSLAGTNTDTIRVLSNGDTTPIVRGILTLWTNNSAPTSITRFLGTASGDVFSLRINDTNTTIVNGTYIVTGTGGNLTPSSGDLITFVSVAGTTTGAVPVAYVISN